MKLRRAVVNALEGPICNTWHRVPGWVQYRFPPCPFASLSQRLDERWGTEQWTRGPMPGDDL